MAFFLILDDLEIPLGGSHFLAPTPIVSHHFLRIAIENTGFKHPACCWIYGRNVEATLALEHHSNWTRTLGGLPWISMIKTNLVCPGLLRSTGKEPSSQSQWGNLCYLRIQQVETSVSWRRQRSWCRCGGCRGWLRVPIGDTSKVGCGATSTWNPPGIYEFLFSIYQPIVLRFYPNHVQDTTICYQLGHHLPRCGKILLESKAPVVAFKCPLGPLAVAVFFSICHSWGGRPDKASTRCFLDIYIYILYICEWMFIS